MSPQLKKKTNSDAQVTLQTNYNRISGSWTRFHYFLKYSRYFLCIAKGNYLFIYSNKNLVKRLISIARISFGDMTGIKYLLTPGT